VRTILSLAVGSDQGQTGVRPGSDQGQTPLVIRVTGDGFLRHMVRSIAGTLVDVGLGRWPASQVAEILAGRDRSRAGRAAPAAGLWLVRVDYGR
jgi:tRNA pseudouridine(38-40) synthase